MQFATRVIPLIIFLFFINGVTSTAVASSTRSAHAPVIAFEGNAQKGQAWLTRTSHGLKLKLHTSGLPSGYSYSIWWLIYNNPGACAMGAGACNPDDFGNPAVEGSVMNATGRIADGDGRLWINATLAPGFMHSVPNRQLFGPGLQNLYDAEIHVIVRCHGPTIPEINVAQVSMIDGGCDQYECFDPQFAAFPIRGKRRFHHFGYAPFFNKMK